jgi:IS1 family transposase/transposase-like protein
MVIRERCPECGSIEYKKNGHIHNGKQNHLCHNCGRQFVFEYEQRVISEKERSQIEDLLCERISLHGICRVMGVSMTWLLEFATACYSEAPEHLNFQSPVCFGNVMMRCLKVEADELASFVGKKANKQWVWLAMDVASRQIMAYHIGDRSKNSAKALWEKIPEVYRQQAIFHTDAYAAYEGVIPAAQHRHVGKKLRTTNHIERFNCTLRQRVFRLVRATLSFSKKLSNHIGAIRFFLCRYNVEVTQV